MKRLILPGLAILAVVALFNWGNRILEQTLDAELPKLLTRELGIPVTLAPTRTWIPTLTVNSPKLVMGDPASPALVANRISVSLDWADLLHGEIRLRRATGDGLMVKPSLWPGNDDPWPTDYRFLDPYLPDYLELESASYVDAGGDSHAFNHPEWHRQAAGASLTWLDGTSGQPIGITVALGSIDDLLRLARMNLQFSATASGNDDPAVKVSLELEPGEQSGYSLAAHIDAAGMTAAVVTGNSSAWKLPDQSSTTIDQFDIEKFQALVKSYRGNADGEGPEAFLATPLPRLSLPAHRGRVSIKEIRWRNEVGTNTGFDFTTGPDGVSIPTLSSAASGGTLQGELSIASSHSGWQVGLAAELEAAEAGTSLAAPYLEAHWFWREGSGKLTGQGETWGALLNSLQGDIALSGSHHGAVETPVTITARLDNRPAEFALDTIEIALGSGRITGSAALAGDEQKRLTGKVRAEQLNLDFLLPPPDPTAPPGMELPTYLEILPGMDLDLQLDISALSLGTINISQGSLGFTRTPTQATLTASARDGDGGRIDLRLGATGVPGKSTEVALRTDLSNVRMSELFRQAPTLLDIRTSGVISFSSRGSGLEQIFTGMKGTADLSLDLRPDHNWKRPPLPEDQLRVSGEAALVLENSRITGLQVSKLALDSSLQNLTGSVSIVKGRKPWLEADLTSDRLDLAALAKHRPKGAPDQPGSDILTSLRQLGESRFTLQAKSVLVAGLPLSDLALQVSTAPGSVSIGQLDFSLDQGSLASRGEIRGLKDAATLSLDARVNGFRLDRFLADTPAVAGVPLSGTVTLRSSGNTTAGLLAELTGDIQLATAPGSDRAAPGASATVDMTARRTADGMHAVIRRFQWEGTDLAGSVQYHATTPPLLEVEISSGSLSLLPWEATDTDSKAAAAAEADGSIVTRAAKAGASLMGDVVLAPLRLISGPREAEPGEKLFSTTPLPIEWMSKYQARIKGKLDTFSSRKGTASDLEFSTSLVAGQLAVEASAGTLNQGSAAARLSMNLEAQPPTLALSGTFSNMRGSPVKSGFPRSGYFDISSRGRSQAELAAGVNGLLYLELGAGVLDYSSMMLLTADVATSVFQTLIPGTDKSQPQLECAVTLGLFKDGIGSSPYGYAARTSLANLVGRVEIDLKKELLHLNFSSSSRKGLGFSIGNVFSNTVEVEGPLTDPKILPNATGLLWRSWAAVMTGGLSVVGESVLKRALASENPCAAVKEHIRKDICGTSQPAAASPLVCPPA